MATTPATDPRPENRNDAPNAEQSSPLIEMKDVEVAALREPGRIVLEEVNWSLNPGDFWAIGGLHASGKSDFMATAAGVMPPARGTYRVFGREMQPDFEQEHVDLRLRLGMVFDGGQLLHHLTIAENISLPIRYHRNCAALDCARRVEALLDWADLAPWADEYPGQLALSRRQRAGLARALALQPEVLLLDSPLTGLDPRDTAWWLEVLAQLAAGQPILDGRPLTVVVSGDDLRAWKGLARQFGALQQKTFVNLGAQPDTPSGPPAWLDDWYSPKPSSH